MTKTEILKIGSSKAVSRAAEVLARGGVIIYPTETSYGMGVDATNDKAVLNVIKIKKRGKSKHILIAFCDVRMAKKYLILTRTAELLAKNFMPGPLALIVESKGAGGKKVGFRIPANKTVLRIIRKFGKPITTTSANVSGGGDNYRIAEIVRIFDGKVDLILDGGNLRRTKPSTIYDSVVDKVVRKGPISEKAIRSIVNQ
jgi:L-threonylcarbamoyladenylate synthase